MLRRFLRKEGKPSFEPQTRAHLVFRRCARNFATRRSCRKLRRFRQCTIQDLRKIIEHSDVHLYAISPRNSIENRPIPVNKTCCAAQTTDYVCMLQVIVESKSNSGIFGTLAPPTFELRRRLPIGVGGRTFGANEAASGCASLPIRPRAPPVQRTWLLKSPFRGPASLQVVRAACNPHDVPGSQVRCPAMSGDESGWSRRFSLMGGDNKVLSVSGNRRP